MFVLNHSDEEFVLAAEAEGIDSGITLKCYTSQKVFMYIQQIMSMFCPIWERIQQHTEKIQRFVLKPRAFPML